MQFPTSGSQPLEAGDPVQVGAYRLLGRLGHGGMGQVFLGVSRGGRQVAVKVMRPDLVADPELRARFAREVAAARTVNGFYTAPVVDAAPDATPPWMITAYVQGPSLAAAVDEPARLPSLRYEA
jgi:serine/threonine protein kinase